MENVEEIVRTREAAAVATESGGVATTSDETAGDKMAATGGVMYTDEGGLEFDENEMAALEEQHLVELFPDSGSKPDFEGFHASEPAGNLSGGDNNGSEAVTESDDDEGMTGRLSDAAAAAAYRTKLNLPDFIHPHGLLIHASVSSAYEIFCSLFLDELLALLVEKTNKYYNNNNNNTFILTRHM